MRASLDLFFPCYPVRKLNHLLQFSLKTNLPFGSIMCVINKIQSHIDRIFRKACNPPHLLQKIFPREKCSFLPILKLIEIHVGK